MSKYLLNKFLFTVDRDPELVERALGRLSRRVADTILQAQSECWWAARLATSRTCRRSPVSFLAFAQDP